MSNLREDTLDGEAETGENLTAGECAALVQCGLRVVVSGVDNDFAPLGINDPDALSAVGKVPINFLALWELMW